MMLLVSIVAFLLRILRLFLDLIDLCLRFFNIKLHLLSLPFSSSEYIFCRFRNAKVGDLPSLTSNGQWRSRLEDSLRWLTREPSTEVTTFSRWIGYRAVWEEFRLLQCFEAIPRRFPQALVHCLHRPIFIIGLPRSGTTILHRLLSLHPDVTFISGSDCHLNGVKASDVELSSSVEDLRDRIRKAGRMHSFAIKALRSSGCNVSYTVHPIGITGPEECALLMNKYLFYTSYPFINGKAMTDVVDLNEDLAQIAYRHYKRDLQVLQFLNLRGSGDSLPSRRFLLKTPYHSCFVNTILKKFPDACFVRLHRNPAESTASLSSFFREIRVPFERVDSKQIGAENRLLIKRLARGLVESQTKIQPNSVIDVKFEEIKDLRSVCKKVTAAVGLNYTADLDQNIQNFLHKDRNNRREAGFHNYSLTEFGLDGEKIRQDCQEYCQMFGV